MTPLRVFLSRVLALFTKRRTEVHLNAEIQAHLDLLSEVNVRSGMSVDDARAAARREFGGIDQMVETYRDQRGLPFVETVIQDIRYAIRTFRRSPGFVVAVLLSLSLGIGVNSAIFTVLNAVILRSLPVRNAGELFVARPEGLAGIPIRTQFSYPVFEQLRHAATASGSVAGMSRIARMYRLIDGERESQLTAVQLVSGEFFSTLGVAPERGRLLAPEDNQQVGGHPVAVISHGFWLRAFGGAPDIVGRRLSLNGAPFTIVGVTEQGFSGVWLESPAEIWIPLMMQADVHYAQNFSDSDADPQKPWLSQEGIRWLDVVGRGTGPTTASAIQTAYLRTVAQEGESINEPSRRARFMQQRLTITPVGQGFSNLRTQFVPPLFAVFGMAALILLIACANTANLLLARASSRQREIAVRLSIGASRARLVRQLLTEGLLLVAIATVVGLLVAGWAGDVLVRQALGSTGSVPFPVEVNGRVIGFTIVISMATVLLFGLVPAFRTTSLELGTALKVSSARASRSRSSLQKLLVAAQVALSLALLAGAGLFVRTLQNYASVTLGFSPEHILTASINPHAVGYSPERLPQLYRDLIARVESVPGVNSASVSLCALLTGCQQTSGITIEGYELGPGEDLRVQENYISLNYFATTGMRLVEGRNFDDRDKENTPKVAIVNRAMVKRFFPGQRGLGRRFGYDSPDVEIVGVVEDSRFNRIQDAPRPMAFYPLMQMPVDASALEVRAAGDPRSIVTDVRRAIAEVDATLPIDRVTILSEQATRSLRQERLVAGLASIFGILALGLACVGLFGVMSYAVSRRVTEFGIRMALGARRSHVLGLVFRESLAVVGYGLAAGIPATLVASSLLSSLLFGVSPKDPLTVFIAASLLLAVAAVASLLPAWRASRVDPMVALRCE